MVYILSRRSLFSIQIDPNDDGFRVVTLHHISLLNSRHLYHRKIYRYHRTMKFRVLRIDHDSHKLVKCVVLHTSVWYYGLLEKNSRRNITKREIPFVICLEEFFWVGINDGTFHDSIKHVLI